MGKQREHGEISDLLPWFINNTLSEREAQRVLAHLAECAACRAERDRLQAIGGLLADDQPVIPDYRFAMKKVMARIKAVEQAEAAALEAQTHDRVHRRNWRVIAGVAAMLLVAIGVVTYLQPAPEPPAFHTLTAPGGEPFGELRQLAVTFEQPLKADTMRQALIETRANIISGPDQTGTYVIEVTMPPAVSKQAFIDSIRRIDGVQLARFAPAGDAR